jgi:hypothetical protein
MRESLLSRLFIGKKAPPVKGPASPSPVQTGEPDLDGFIRQSLNVSSDLGE